MRCACCSARPSCTAPTPSSSPSARCSSCCASAPGSRWWPWRPLPLASILVQYLGRRIHDRFERIQASFSEISAAGPGELLRRAAGARLRPRGVADRSLRAAQSPVHRPRPAPGSADGHAVAYARIHSRRLDDHHPAGRRPPGHRAPHHRRPVRGLQHLHDPAHLADHRRGLGGQHLPARHRLGQAHRRAAAAEPAIDDRAADPAIAPTRCWRRD